ncbi:MAG: hypothetical protein V2I25_12730 [Woeseiaceae bacterium]|jgi:hypothetical protein|nr:hypothetical protein [Woeseiaceae bacterium]
MRVCLSIILLGLLVSPAAESGPRERITAVNSTLCDTENRVCLRGTLTYYANPRLVELRSRVLRASGPGLVTLRLAGENALGETRYTTLDVRIRGRYSEIVNHKLVTDHPDVEQWRLESIRFRPDPQPDSGAA